MKEEEGEEGGKKSPAGADRRPGVLARFLFRSPLLLYRLRLGFLMGRRIIVLTHRGRKTGKLRRTAIEVVRYDEETGEIFVVSAYGGKSDWYLNITRSPPVLVQLGGRKFVPEFRMVPPEEERARLAAYYSDHTTDAKFLAKRFLHVADTEEGFVKGAGALPMVAFWPREALVAEDPGRPAGPGANP